MGYWTDKGNIIALSKIQSNADTTIPVKVRNQQKVKSGDYIA